MVVPELDRNDIEVGRIVDRLRDDNVFQRRRRRLGKSHSPNWRSFNGADVFQRRRRPEHPEDTTSFNAQIARASMGPTSFNVGDYPSAGGGSRPQIGFNGADVFQRRRHASWCGPCVRWKTASMGPTSFNVGDNACLLTCLTFSARNFQASMGPTSFNVGDRSRRKSPAGKDLRIGFREVLQGGLSRTLRVLLPFSTPYK